MKAPEQIFADPPEFTRDKYGIHNFVRMNPLQTEYVRCTLDELTNLRRIAWLTIEIGRLDSLLDGAGGLSMREEDEAVQQIGKLSEELETLLSSLRSGDK
jgi:hypothetical protein